MNLPAPPPEDFLAALRNSATRRETPCGSGSLVWHVWGGADAEHAPVVLLHGGSGSWTHWACNIAALVQAGRQVLVPDLPGFGDSARPATGRDADALVAPLEVGLQTLIGTQVCDLVGFSFGGMTAGLWTAAFPARVRRLVIAGAPGLGVVGRWCICAERIAPYRRTREKSLSTCHALTQNSKPYTGICNWRRMC